MKMAWRLVWLGLVVCLLQAAWAQGEEARAEVGRILRENDRKHYCTHKEELAKFGPEVITLLASYLTDAAIGYQAAGVMLEIDPVKAGPLLFNSMPKSDRNVQCAGFTFFNRLLLEGKPVACTQEMHDAAARCLEAKTNADAAVEALYALGLTGSKKDYPLLTRYEKNTHETPIWRARLCRAAVAALARLGQPAAQDTIAAALRRPVPATLTADQAMALFETMKQAAFANQHRYLPLLARHLQDPPPPHGGHVVFPHPAQTAAQAMDTLVNHVPFARSHATVAEWQAWWAKHQGEYRG